MSTYIVVHGEESEGSWMIGAFFTVKDAMLIFNWYSEYLPCSCDYVELWKVVKNKKRKRNQVMLPGLLLLKKRSGGI